LYWSVPVVLTSPVRGVVGEVGDIRVDAATGEMLLDEAAVGRLTDNVRRLASLEAPEIPRLSFNHA
jgi:hypothetical protein